MPVQKKSKNYKEFLEKFEEPKTTDDCYTPAPVYDCIREHLMQIFPLSLAHSDILRPFYPGGDYQAQEYKPGQVVIDNPPFSKISKITRFYTEREIPFFLFAPHLTLFSSHFDCTYIVVGALITYENGAKVRTSFLSNLFGDTKIIGDARLLQKMKAIDQEHKTNMPKYQYPDNLLTVSKIQKAIDRGETIAIHKNELSHRRRLDSQKEHKKSIFGSGFICGEAAALQVKKAIYKPIPQPPQDSPLFWQLSQEEKQVVKTLKK